MQFIYSIWNFLLSSNSAGVATLVAGSVALILYYKSKFDRKKEAASIILLEIQTAERQIKLVKEDLAKNKNYLPDIFVMPNESWSKYNYLFLSEFNRNEWDIISSFYNNCILYDRAVEYNQSFFQKNEQEIRVNRQRVIADFVKEYSEKDESGLAAMEKNKKEMNKKVEAFIEEYMTLNTTNPLVLYNPQKPVTDGNIYMSGLDGNISLMSLGSKLERIASSKFLLLFR